MSWLDGLVAAPENIVKPDPTGRVMKLGKLVVGGTLSAEELERRYGGVVIIPKAVFEEIDDDGNVTWSYSK
jgi:hypothetical protein